MDYPFCTQDEEDFEPTEELIEIDNFSPFMYVKNILDGSVLGYKYLEFNCENTITVTVRGKAKGQLQISFKDMRGYGSKVQNHAGNINMDLDSDDWIEITANIAAPTGVKALYIKFVGEGSFDFRQFVFR